MLFNFFFTGNIYFTILSTFIINLNAKFHIAVHHGSPTRGQPDFIMRLAVTLVNNVYTLKISQQFTLLGITGIAILPSAAHGPAHNNRPHSLP
jgi:hypothetical protein